MKYGVEGSLNRAQTAQQGPPHALSRITKYSLWALLCRIQMINEIHLMGFAKLNCQLSSQWLKRRPSFLVLWHRRQVRKTWKEVSRFHQARYAEQDQKLIRGIGTNRPMTRSMNLHFSHAPAFFGWDDTLFHRHVEKHFFISGSRDDVFVRKFCLLVKNKGRVKKPLLYDHYLRSFLDSKSAFSEKRGRWDQTSLKLYLICLILWRIAISSGKEGYGRGL